MIEATFIDTTKKAKRMGRDTCSQVKFCSSGQYYVAVASLSLYLYCLSDLYALLCSLCSSVLTKAAIFFADGFARSRDRW